MAQVEAKLPHCDTGGRTDTPSPSRMEVLREQLEGDLMRRELVAASARQWLGKPWSQVGADDAMG